MMTANDTNVIMSLRSGYSCFVPMLCVNDRSVLDEVKRMLPLLKRGTVVSLCIAGFTASDCWTYTKR